MKRWLWTMGLLASLAVAQDAPPPVEVEGDDGGRVVGGKDAPPGSAPFQAQIYWSIKLTPKLLQEDAALPRGHRNKQYYADKTFADIQHHCGGALIAADWVLTAAHCLPGKRPFLTTRRVRLGTQDLTVGGVTYAIDRAAIHAAWNQAIKRHDIALLHIVSDAQTARIDPARVATIRILGTAPGDRPLELGDDLSVTGWGKTKTVDENNSRLARDGTVNTGSAKLQVLSELYVLDKARCARVMNYVGRLGPGTLCVGAMQAGKDSCTGDSGGPLTRLQGRRERVLVGLVSWGVGCGLKDVPAIYTDATSREHLDWIERAKRVPLGRVTPVD